MSLFVMLAPGAKRDVARAQNAPQSPTAQSAPELPAPDAPALSAADKQLIAAVYAHDFAAVERAVAADANVNCRSDALPRDCLNPHAKPPLLTPLIIALFGDKSQRDPRITAFLLERGADPNLASTDGLFPLSMAASDGDLKLVELLMAHDADPNAAPARTEAPLAEACYRGHLEVAQLLFARGARLETPGQVGCTALFRAVGFNNSPAVAQWLLKAGANPNALNDLGATPLHHAVEYGYADSAKILVAAGANPDLAAAKGQTPRGLARRFAESTIAKYQAKNRFPDQTPAEIQAQLLAALGDEK